MADVVAVAGLLAMLGPKVCHRSNRTNRISLQLLTVNSQQAWDMQDKYLIASLNYEKASKEAAEEAEMRVPPEMRVLGGHALSV